MTDPGFWDDQDAAQKVINETNWLKGKVESFEALVEKTEDADVMLEMVKEENDEELFEELSSEIENLTKNVRDFELEMLLSEPYDKNNAILELDRKSTRLNSSHVS